MVEASCHCGAVHLTAPSAPEKVTDCNCSICRRYGVLWAYYNPTEVRIDGATDTYMWGDKECQFHRCKICGCITHWAPVDESGDRMAVNARLMEPAIVSAARVRKLDGANSWTYLEN